ncbi:hypothetical protein GOBAR_DD19513 [Gossypium barbadense]|nr:hypothetical protein GOBAR_DD19513 [Gossypium barbadense]
MGALAPALSTWIPEDDLLLKNAIESSILEDPLPVNGFKESVSIFGRMNLEVRMKILEDKVDNETINWMMENFKLSVKKPIEVVLTKDELQHLAFLCKSEVDSIGRLTAGILRLLKLEKSLGKEAMNKLSNLGKYVSTNLIQLKSLNLIGPELEEAVSDSQAKCAALITESSNSESSQAGASLESMAKGTKNSMGLSTIALNCTEGASTMLTHSRLGIT